MSSYLAFKNELSQKNRFRINCEELLWLCKYKAGFNNTFIDIVVKVCFGDVNTKMKWKMYIKRR